MWPAVYSFHPAPLRGSRVLFSAIVTSSTFCSFPSWAKGIICSIGRPLAGVFVCGGYVCPRIAIVLIRGGNLRRKNLYVPKTIRLHNLENVRFRIKKCWMKFGPCSKLNGVLIWVHISLRCLGRWIFFIKFYFNVFLCG